MTYVDDITDLNKNQIGYLLLEFVSLLDASAHGYEQQVQITAHNSFFLLNIMFA